MLTNISSSLPSIDPATVITSPAKFPISPNFDGVSQTSACAKLAKAKDAAVKAVKLKYFFVKDI